jgi:hypothetical protein
MSFSLLNAHYSSSKLERILTWMINKTNKLKLVKFIFTTRLKTFGSNMLLTLKFMSFEDVALKKFIHFS